MKRSKRLKLIKEIISSKKISSQGDLLNELIKKGYNITQSTISRDLNYLRVAKVRNYLGEEYYTIDKGSYEGKFIDPGKFKSKFNESVISVKRANNIIVVKTFAGEAQGTAAVIDGMNFIEILGTVAGDDTVICVINSSADAEKVLNLMQEQF
ncbi:MAG: arginine repressor [Actinomycetota bacterium]|nr:arginine repressor [Actinomycetota bacterium]